MSNRKLNTVLVGLDLTDASEPALLQGCAIAHAHDAQLVLVHASGLTEAALYAHDEAVRTGAPWKHYIEERMAKAQQLLDSAAARCKAAGADVTTRLIHGHVDAAILEGAKDAGADLVVVGTHGRAGGERWLLGSVAEQVLRQSPCGVLVARVGTEPPRGVFERVLVATDFSETAEAGVLAARAIASSEAYIAVVHCWQPPVFVEVVPPAEMLARIRARANALGEELMARHSDDRLQFLLVDAQPADGILAAARKGDYELLVLGSHGRRGVRRLLLGSVAENVARRAAISTLVVHASG